MAENKVKPVLVGDAEVGGERLVIVAGPCALESLELALSIAREMKKLCDEFNFGYIFKASFDKANRTSISSYRGPGIRQGLEWLAVIRKEVGDSILNG